MTVLNLDALDKKRYWDNTTKGSVSSFESDMYMDTFGALYKYAPMVQTDVPIEKELNKHIMSNMMELPEYKQLRVYTTGHLQNSIDNIDIVSPILANIPKAVKDSQKEIENISNQIEQCLNSNNYDPDTLKNLFNELNQAKTELTEQLSEHGDFIRQNIRKTLVEAEQSTFETEQAFAILGYSKGGDGQGESGNTEDKIKIANALKQNSKLKKIMKLAGRMVNIASKKQKQKISYIRSEISGIEFGDDLSMIVPSEYGYLMHENKALNTLFLKKLSQGECMQYEQTGREPESKGPIIVAIDCSGSMSGMPDTWAKACALAMYSIARIQKRNFSVMLFNHSVKSIVSIAKGKHSPNDLANILLHAPSGGTNFESPLNKCLELINTNEHSKADIIFITDGICEVSESFLKTYHETKKQKEFSTYAILIGGSDYEKTLMKKFSDSVTCLYDSIGQNESQAFDIAFSI